LVSRFDDELAPFLPRKNDGILPDIEYLATAVNSYQWNLGKIARKMQDVSVKAGGGGYWKRKLFKVGQCPCSK
jgi:hypothetical protein